MEEILHNQGASPDTSLPVEAWCKAMQSAVDEICDLGLKLLKEHQATGEQAQQAAINWKLPERQTEEREALHRLFDAARMVVERLDAVIRQPSAETMQAATDSIETNLPVLEQSFLVVRHAALDLLRWARRYGKQEGSTLAEEYRAGYARFAADAPMLRPRLEKLQQDLMLQSEMKNSTLEVKPLLAALSRYNAFAQTSRSFVQAVVDPPLDLVFQETNLFLNDYGTTSVELRTHMASEINDCCQFLLYDMPAFDGRVNPVQLKLKAGMESSLYELEDQGWKILFTVEEDPMFGQITVTLLRLVSEADSGAARNDLIKTLFDEFEVEHG